MNKVDFSDVLSQWSYSEKAILQWLSSDGCWMNFGDNKIGRDQINREWRIKPEEIPTPEPTLQERIEAAYSDYRVEMLERDVNNVLRTSCGFTHGNAISMKGFAGYVYPTDDKNEFSTSKYPTTYTRNTGINVDLPIAVLYEK